jgi:nucleoid DNA-binding protein
MTRKELAANLSEEAYFSVKMSSEFVDLLFEIMGRKPGKGRENQNFKFREFHRARERARTGRNPKTGEKMQIPGRRVVIFKPSLILRKALNRGGQ